MIQGSTNSLKIGDEEYYIETIAPLYTRRPLQVVDEQSQRLEDRFHRTVKITRLSDGHTWTRRLFYPMESRPDPGGIRNFARLCACRIGGILPS